MSKRIAALLVAVGVAGAAYGQTSATWTQLSLSTCRVNEFLSAHPDSDGRGVIIAVLDTGVDPSIPGLTRTPDGAVKVIDLVDCTGAGDVELHRVRLDEATGKVVNHDEDGSPIQYDLPTLQAGDAAEERLFWFGTMDESKWVNSDMPDLNDNGKTDDEFPLLVTALDGDGDEQAVCYVDTNLDRSFADEQPLHNYRLKYDTFTLFRRKPEKQIEPVAFSINIFLRQAKVVVHYDDGAHGTHVAGIAAGFRINNQDGFNGVAPGAKVMGLKIGKGDVGGISSTDAFKNALKYAGRYSREHGVPIVCNLSFGVESVIEGNSDIDKFMDDFLREHPTLVFCTSAGNEGPGLSSVGTPAAADQLISVAAVLAADSARDVMGMQMTEPVVTVFSSRGGELNKPDLATPGWSTSTVPRWVRRGDYWAGTSMASPYAAGLCAVLISDAMQKHPGVPIRAWDVRRALCLSARPVAGAGVLDAGYGLPDLPKAAELLDRFVVASKDDPVIGYDISTPCPHGYKGTARAAYWRGTWFPNTQEDQRQTFTVKPIFAPGTDASARTSFTRQFDLRCDVPWIRIPQQQTYLRSEQTARVYVEYDAAQLSKPGVYTGAVEALHDGLVAFRLLNTVVVPYRTGAAADFKLSFKDRTVKGWAPDRYFVAVPPGASAMKLTLSAPEGAESKASMERIFAPDGARHRDGSRRLDTQAGRREAEGTFTDELVPGVWEVDVVSDRPDKDWAYELGVRFFGLDAEPRKITEWSGSKPSGELMVTNLFERPLPASADGVFEGFRMHKEDKFEGLDDELSYSIDLDERFDRLRLELEMTPEAYATTTDIGVYVEGPDGKNILFDAFSNRTVKTTVDTGGAKSVKVIIRGGFAVADDERETPIDVKIDRLLAEPIAIKVTRGESSNVDFVPGVPIQLDFAMTEKLPEAPDGTRPVGYLRFRERSSDDEALRVPIDIGG
ncbi:MAG TPA: S8 family serine peptidase [Thermoguttaceae bacterium]|nr:S8 family serine peptidase [Thermoguttaceae bacterium]HUU84965.1 S8 family serine peptidase [Phycisphaerae bacterium]